MKEWAGFSVWDTAFWKIKMIDLKAIRNIIALLFLPILLVGCIATKIKGFTDHKYRGHLIRKVVICAPNAGFSFGGAIEDSFVEKFRSSGVEAESFLVLFPPTREWNATQINIALIEKGYDSIMYVSLTGSDTTVSTVGYTNTGTINVYGNNAYYQSRSVPVSTINRYTSTRVQIYDVETAETVWVADTTTSAGGLLFIEDKAQADSIAMVVVTDLAKAGHAPKAPSNPAVKKKTPGQPF
jgi:hypothetical protein